MSVSPELLALREAITTADERDPLLRVELPLTTVSEANAHEHWRGRQMRAKEQRASAWGSLLAAGVKWRTPRVPLVVLLTRVAPRALDSDNLPRALKACRDGVADALGVDDRDPMVTWLVDQRKGVAGVVVEIFRSGGAK